ncbi:oxygen-insensitive NADPH nitroreductase [Clostridium estertheticum]|uniref:oxygen-insensitive NADPH nitroreductase n=1 Tax=Clostridium estertheticum TaxID=238834 RepID=UPI0013E90F32|nr:oxygen-insensitive NADPH nitroreductase [Clostridium estertheticum]MBZ9688564.1 oxygen-insensitive NADPH nitroreductase [Clostridium estertheticum]
MNETINLLKAHKSIRKYKDQIVEAETIKTIIECAQSASTSGFIQAYTIISVVDKSKRKDIAHLAGDQSYVEECPLFLVFCADLNRIKNCCEINHKTMLEGYTETFIVATVDATLAAQNALIAAESLGLGGVYIGGIRNNPSEMCKILNIPSGVYPVFGMCIGYPDDAPDIKARLPLEVILKTDEYNIDGDAKKIEEYDAQVSAYYKKRTKGKRSDTWTNQVSGLIDKPQRPHMKDFLDKQGFKMK